MATIAVALAFGFLMAVVCFVRGNLGGGAAMLGFTVFMAGLVFSPKPSTRFLLTCLATAVCGIAFAYHAVQSELTGKTVEYHGGRTGFAVAVPVTRQASPGKFRICTNWRWALGLGFLGLSVVCFKFYRSAESPDWL